MFGQNTMNEWMGQEVNFFVALFRLTGTMVFVRYLCDKKGSSGRMVEDWEWQICVTLNFSFNVSLLVSVTCLLLLSFPCLIHIYLKGKKQILWKLPRNFKPYSILHSSGFTITKSSNTDFPGIPSTVKLSVNIHCCSLRHRLLLIRHFI